MKCLPIVLIQSFILVPKKKKNIYNTYSFILRAMMPDEDAVFL
jgi:hypothetical protein